MTNVQYFFRAECGSEDRWSDKIGPFPEFLQLTYEDLRSGPDGDTVAQTKDGLWYLAADGYAESWTDIVMWAEVIEV